MDLLCFRLETVYAGTAALPTLEIIEKPGFSATLDHVRWLSAFVVLCGHARNSLFLPYAAAPDLGVAGQAFYLLTNLQNEAVVCFFVISGLLIGGKLLDYAGRRDFPTRRYMIDRVTRLYVVLLPALALSGGVAVLGICESEGAAEWLGVVFQLQHILVPTMACNKPIWSLANEFWYYTLGLAAALSWRGSRIALAALVAVLALLLAADPWTPQNVLLGLPFWCLGAGVYWVRRPLLGPRLSFVLFVLTLLISRSHVLEGVFWLRDALIALSLTVFLSAVSQESASGAIRLGGWGHRLASFSFTLYLTHWPLLMLYTHAVKLSSYHSYPLNPKLLQSYAVWAGAVLSCIAFAALMARFTEARTGAVRAFLEAKLRF
jgi:peptidoglycan/LPS O-acetylase OafA/YrhL